MRSPLGTGVSRSNTSDAARAGRLRRRPATDGSTARGVAPLFLLTVFVALVPRIGYVLANPGGYQGTFEYDPSVYYASGAAILHGRWPYADFFLLHPPGLPLVLTPFAALGAATHDSVGFVAAQLAFAVVGAVNAGLVVLVARRLGAGLVGAGLGGLVYALWPGATNAEWASRLEPLGNLAVLLGLLAFANAERSGRRRPAVLAGAGFGLACCVKIWWLAPLALLLAWHASAQRRSRLRWVAFGAAVPMLVVNLPFLLKAPRAMVHMVVVAQLERPAESLPYLDRFSSMSGIGAIALEPPVAVAVPVAILFALVLVWVCRLAARHTHGALLVAMTALTLALLAVGRSYFPYYDDFVAPFLALTVALAAADVTVRADARRRWGAAIGAVALAVATLDVGATVRQVKSYPTAELRPVVAQAHCVMSDSPMALIELDVLDRDLANGCRNWIDVTGHAFDRGVARQREWNDVWQRDLVGYLLSGDELTLFRARYTGVSPELRRIVASLPKLVQAGHFAIYRVKPLPARTRRLAHRLRTHHIAPPPRTGS